MTKLSNMKIGISVMSNQLNPKHMNERERDAYRYKNMPWRKWYFSSRWQKLRWEILERDHFTCQEKDCGIVLVHKPYLLVANHRIPHNGNGILFWDKSNLVCTCKDCHDSLVQSRESIQRSTGR